jgi:hypothetical protein
MLVSVRSYTDNLSTKLYKYLLFVKSTHPMYQYYYMGGHAAYKYKLISVLIIQHNNYKTYHLYLVYEYKLHCV